MLAGLNENRRLGFANHICVYMTHFHAASHGSSHDFQEFANNACICLHSTCNRLEPTRLRIKFTIDPCHWHEAQYVTCCLYIDLFTFAICNFRGTCTSLTPVAICLRGDAVPYLGMRFNLRETCMSPTSVDVLPSRVCSPIPRHLASVSWESAKTPSTIIVVPSKTC